MSEPKKCGTRSGYVLGCRCAACVEANRAYLADYRKGKKMSDEANPGGGRPAEKKEPPTSAELAAGTKGAEAAKAQIARRQEKGGDEPAKPAAPAPQPRGKNVLAEFWGM